MNPSKVADHVVDDRERGIFRVRRRAFTDPAVLEREHREVFDRCWLYACHESELAKPGGFIARKPDQFRPILQVRLVFSRGFPRKSNVPGAEPSSAARTESERRMSWARSRTCRKSGSGRGR